VDLGLEHRVLEKKGAWISFNGNLVGQGREAAKEAIRGNAELGAAIAQGILSKVNVVVGSTLGAPSPSVAETPDEDDLTPDGAIDSVAPIEETEAVA
jgi:recombination protein RecA